MHSSHALAVSPRVVAAACLVVLACGGNVSQGPEPPGTGGAAGVSGTGALGGSGGSSTGGTGGSAVGGAGGTSTGGIGGTGATGGTGGHVDACPDLPSCNWCGGVGIYDANGCMVAYQCANGVDPCTTPPCDPSAFEGCGPGCHCANDGLCWPGSPCGDKACSTPNWNCDCSWSCPDGNSYRTYCVGTGSGSQSCECSTNGQVTHGCAEQIGSAGGPGDWCGSPTCCGFPE